MLVIFTENQLATLAHEQTLATRLACMQQITVRLGRVWLTLEGDSVDYFLQAGQSMVLPADRLIVLEADRGLAQFVVQAISLPMAKPVEACAA